MSKSWETKNRILESLKVKPKTLTTLSKELSLAPSTVSQHLHELLRMGRIAESDGSQSRKWKYYEIRVAVSENQNFWQRNQTPVIAIASALILLGIFAYLSAGAHLMQQGALSAAGQPGNTIISFSDSPQSYNISGVYLQVKNVSVRSATNGTIYALPISNANANLVALANISQAISVGSLPAGSYNAVYFTVANAVVTINGTNRTLIMPTNRLSFEIPFTVSAGNSTNWMNLDFNLSSSIRIASSGEVVLLPVVTVTYYNHSVLNVGSGGIIRVQSYGSVASRANFGLSVSGQVVENFSTPASANLTISQANGTVTIHEAPSNTTITVRRNGSGLVIITGNNIGGINVSGSGSLVIGVNGIAVNPNGVPIGNMTVNSIIGSSISGGTTAGPASSNVSSNVASSAGATVNPTTGANANANGNIQSTATSAISGAVGSGTSAVSTATGSIGASTGIV